MQTGFALLCVTLCIFTAHLSRTYGMTLMNPEKRGWTLNSAGYLLGPYAQGSLNVRHRATVGRRDILNEISSLPMYQTSNDDLYLLSLLANLANLHSKEMAVTEDFSSPYSDHTKN
nr:galanin peptides-like [Misgurnus anguillicaudatus]XP_055031407.1 galanin peptides-like [Misgurnus anguillicaudatus]